MGSTVVCDMHVFFFFFRLIKLNIKMLKTYWVINIYWILRKPVVGPICTGTECPKKQIYVKINQRPPIMSVSFQVSLLYCPLWRMTGREDVCPFYNYYSLFSSTVQNGLIVVLIRWSLRSSCQRVVLVNNSEMSRLFRVNLLIYPHYCRQIFVRFVLICLYTHIIVEMCL